MRHRLLLLPLLVACTPKAGPPRPARVEATRLAEHVRVIAADDTEGREPGSPGERKAIDYVIGALHGMGVAPGVPDGSWLQAVPLRELEPTAPPALQVRSRSGETAYNAPHELVVWSKHERAALHEVPVVYVGYGVVAPELDWNDYAGVDVRGKLVLVLVNDPDFFGAEHQRFGGKAMTYYGRWTYKFEEAARQGAIGALVIHETAAAAYPWEVVVSTWTGPQFQRDEADPTPALQVQGWIPQRVASELLGRGGLDAARLFTEAQAPGFRARPLEGVSASLELTQRAARTTAHNVIGVLPGGTRPEEVVMIGAHIDHLGRCPAVDGDDICNGAEDNALGVAAMLELARLFAERHAEAPLARSVAFIAFTAEEYGLLGSAHYAAHPVFAPERTVALINIDGEKSYGPTRDITVIGYGKTTLDELLAAHAAAQGRRVAPEPSPEKGGYFRSDHFNFAKLGIPGLYTATGIDLLDGGPERGRALTEEYTAKRYHKPDDEYGPAWDLSGRAQDYELLFALAAELASGEAWPAWKVGAEFKAVREASRGR